MQTHDTLPTHIERVLTLDILRGKYAAGTRLPTVRKLASKFGANQATIQRVVARLETRGLILARQGSGLSVNDPTTVGDLSLLPYWLEATLHDPDRAARILEDFLEVRRIVAVQLLVRHRSRLLAALPALAGAATDVIHAAAEGIEAFAKADIAFARRLVLATGNSAALAMLNTVAHVLDEVPVVATAMYGEPRTNLAGMAAVMTALRGDGDHLGDAVERALRKVDARTIARFDELLRSAAGSR